MPYNFGETLKNHRNRNKISVKQISEILTNHGYKTSESTIYNWENNHSQPTPGAFLLMCKTYNIEDILDAFGYGSINKAVDAPSPHENKVITAYRNQPDTQPFVDRLLGIANESTESPVHKVAIAAFGGNGVEIRKLTDEQYQKTRVLKSKLKYKTSGNDLD